jgi:hypothetical protein
MGGASAVQNDRKSETAAINKCNREPVARVVRSRSQHLYGFPKLPDEGAAPVTPEDFSEKSHFKPSIPPI